MVSVCGSKKHAGRRNTIIHFVVGNKQSFIRRRNTIVVAGSTTLFQSKNSLSEIFLGAKIIDSGKAQFVFLSESCDEPNYKKLVKALCAEKSVPLYDVPDSKKLGKKLCL